MESSWIHLGKSLPNKPRKVNMTFKVNTTLSLTSNRMSQKSVMQQSLVAHNKISHDILMDKMRSLALAVILNNSW